MDGQLIEAGKDRLQRDIDKWGNANDTFINYKEFISCRNDESDLQYLDLLFVSNYKGGNSTIGGIKASVDDALATHRNYLREFSRVFGSQLLKKLSIENTDRLIKMMLIVFDSCRKNGRSCITGFDVANCAALYHMHFPNLIPLIDRRILINTRLVDIRDKSKFLGTQVKDIKSYYPKLIEQIAKDLNDSDLNFSDLRNWDRFYFTLKIDKPSHKRH